MGRLCQLSSLGHSYLAYLPLRPALRPRKPTWANYNSLVLWLPLRSGNGETFLQRSEGGRRKRMGYAFLWFSPCSYFGPTRFTRQRPLALSRWASLHNSAFWSGKYFFALFLWIQEGNRSIVLSLEY